MSLTIEVAHSIAGCNRIQSHFHRMVASLNDNAGNSNADTSNDNYPDTKVAAVCSQRTSYLAVNEIVVAFCFDSTFRFSFLNFGNFLLVPQNSSIHNTSLYDALN